MTFSKMSPPLTLWLKCKVVVATESVVVVCVAVDVAESVFKIKSDSESLEGICGRRVDRNVSVPIGLSICIVVTARLQPVRAMRDGWLDRDFDSVYDTAERPGMTDLKLTFLDSVAI